MSLWVWLQKIKGNFDQFGLDVCEHAKRNIVETKDHR
jgi:hypothetical protein